MKLVCTLHISSIEGTKINHSPEELYGDLFGPEEVRRGNLYFISISDEFPGYTHIELINAKARSDILLVFGEPPQGDETLGNIQ